MRYYATSNCPAMPMLSFSSPNQTHTQKQLLSHVSAQQ
jgi:hypothetical protein